MVKWHYTVNGKKHGPVSDQIIRRLARKGCLLPEDFVWKSGMKDWVPARKLKGLFKPASIPSGSTSSSNGRRDMPSTGAGTKLTIAPGADFQTTSLMVLKEGQWVGPYPPGAIQALIASGEILRTDHVRMEVWMPAGNVHQFLAGTSVLTVPKSSPPKAAPVSQAHTAQAATGRGLLGKLPGMAIAAAGGAVVGAAAAKLLAPEPRPAKKGHRSRQGNGLVNRILNVKRKGITKTLFRDSNSDGVTDTVIADRNQDGLLDSIGMDFDQDGLLDAVGVDVDADGILDTIGIDTDADGLLDAVVETDGEAASGLMEGIFGFFSEEE
jgi:hypothetical protein